MPITGQEHEREEEGAADDRDPAGAPSCGDTCTGLDIGRGRGGRGRASCHRGDRVDQQRLADLGELALFVQVAGLLADAHERPHRVEEIRQEEREHPGERADHRGGAGRAADVREGVEVDVAEQAEVGVLDDVVRQPRTDRQRLVVVQLVDQGRERRRADDPDEQVAAEPQRAQGDRERQAEDGHEHRPGGQARKRHGHVGRRRLHDDAGVVEADEGDEQADPDRDCLLQLERDRAHDRLAQAAEHEHGDDGPFQHDQPHRRRKREVQRAHQGEGDDRVDPEPGRERVGTVRVEAHQDRHHPGDQARRGEDAREGQRVAARALDGGEDARVDEDDVRHDDERRHPGEGVAREGRPAP
jgi:hypothetical protein